MNIKYISQVNDVHIGFEWIKPSKRDLLVSNVVLLSNTLQEGLDLFGEFINRIQGIVVTIEDEFKFISVTPKLYHLSVPNNYITDLIPITSSYSLLIEEKKQLFDQFELLDSEKQRLHKHHIQLRENYNSAIQRLENKIEDLRKEVQLRKNIEDQLQNQNEEYLAINDQLRISQQELVAKSEQLILKNKELLNSRLKAEESNQLKTEFIRNMSHEIRTPLNSIMGFSELVGLNDISNDERDRFINIILHNSSQLSRIVEDILEISRLGTRQEHVDEKLVSLNDLLNRQFACFNLKAKEKNIDLFLKVGLPDELSNIISDEYKLLRIINNLLENSLKFTTDGFIEFGYTIKNNHISSIDTQTIEFYFKDTGIGIDENQFQSIFDRFSQADKQISKKVGGLGLGLSIAKENAELLGGTISLESKRGVGTTFYFTLPYHPALIKS